MVPIKEALTFDDVTLVPKYSEVLPSEVDTSIKLTKFLKLKIPLLEALRAYCDQLPGAAPISITNNPPLKILNFLSISINL